jgi:hypothetical protein
VGSWRNFQDASSDRACKALELRPPAVATLRACKALVVITGPKTPQLRRRQQLQAGVLGHVPLKIHCVLQVEHN